MMRRRRTRLRVIVAAAAVLGVLAVAAWMLIPGYDGDLADYRAASKIHDADGRVLRVVLGRDNILCEPIPLAETGDWAVKALVAAEDKRFFEHAGVDPLAICRATAQNVVCRRVVSGASTISTLVVKLTEPRRRNLWTKLVEAHNALDIEKRLTKEDILAQFVNRAPFGSNVRGIESASKRYFGKSARDLSLAESALLVGLPQSPSRLRPDRHLSRALKRRDYVLRRMRACGYISRKQHRNARRQVMAVRREPLPFLAPHFCDFVLERFPKRGVFETTLDMDLQQIAEGVLGSRVSELSAFGVRGGAVVIIDVRSGSLRAMVGSPDFWDRAASGQVNAATARRSPGSTLKPFAYAAAMEQGMYTPAAMIADVPANFAGYSPSNFNRNHHGPVSVRRALVESLNIPALRCVRRLGLESFVGDLRRLGLSTLGKPAAHYGLSIVVGTCETTLLELANAYACLARSGVYVPVRVLKDEDRDAGTRVYSAETAYMIADILGGNERAFDISGHIADVALPRVAWKTGTSTGHRDAWTIAYNPEYVVGVWIGNPDNASSRKLVGSVAAAPVAGEIFRRIYPDGDSPWYDRPGGLKLRKVCARSGAVPSDSCPATVTDHYQPGLSIAKKCDVHRRAGSGGTGRVTEIWPPDIEKFLRTRGMEESAAWGSGNAPGPDVLRIASPADGETFCLFDSAPGVRQELKLAAVSGIAARRLYWFVDGELLCDAGADRPVFWPLERGKHRVVCTDTSGNSDGIQIVVE